MEVAAERLDDLVRLVLAEEAVVDEDAGELVADGLVHEQRRDGRVDAAGKRAQHALGADRRADARDLLLDHGSGRPRRRRAGDLVEEVLQDLLAVRRVRDLGMELHAVELACAVLERGDRRGGRGGGHLSADRRRGDRVAVAHPHRLLGRQVVKELGLVRLELRLSELGRAGTLDRAPEIARHELHPVTDAERRDPELEDAGVEIRRAVGVHRRGTAGEDERRRVPGRDLRGRQAMPDEFRVDACLAHAARDQLAVLAAEIDDEDGAFLGQCFGRRERDDLRHQRR